MFSVPCKTGKIQLDNGVLSVRSFGKTHWQSPVQDVTLFVTQPGAIGTVNVTIASKTGPYMAEMVTKANFAKLQEQFPQVQTQAVGKEWWLNPAMLTHVGVYLKPADMQRELEAASYHGWQMQGQSGTGGIVNVAGFAARAKDQITITFTRTPEWLTQHQQK